jgi:hypothetical protein
MIAQAMLWFINWQEHLDWADSLLIVICFFVFFVLVFCWDIAKLEFGFDNKGDNSEIE